MSFRRGGEDLGQIVQRALEDQRKSQHQIAQLAGGAENLTKASRGLKAIQYLTVGTGTYIPTGTLLLVKVWGGGGGGGGAEGVAGNAAGAGGGQAGGYAFVLIADPADEYAYTVGAGGAGAAAGNNTGGLGGNSTFGSACEAPGGAGGGGMAAGTAAGFSGLSGQSNTPHTGDLIILGERGQVGTRLNASQAASGQGGAAPRGGAGGAGRSSDGAGLAGDPPGGAGGGGKQVGTPSIGGGAGADGLIVVHEYGPP